MPSCPVCDLPANQSAEPSTGTHGDTLLIDCARCSPYRIDAMFAQFLRGLHRQEPGFVDDQEWFPRLHLVSGGLREHSVVGDAEPLNLTQEVIEALSAVAPTDVNDRIDRLLLNLAAYSPFFGANIRQHLTSTHRSLAYAQNDDEYSLMIDTLAGAHLIEMTSRDAAHLTAVGWERVRQLRRSGPNSDQAFVAMSFDPSFDYIYDDGIKLAVKDAGYRPFRLDREEYADLIDDLMIVEINRSRFVVADLTDHNQGAYFEAGYAMGLGRPVIWTCKEGEFKGKAHFDIEHRNHIIWNNAVDLRRRLSLRIKAVIGVGKAITPES